MALTNLLRFGISMQDARVTSLILVPEPDAGRAPPTILLPMSILKMLVHIIDCEPNSMNVARPLKSQQMDMGSDSSSDGCSFSESTACDVEEIDPLDENDPIYNLDILEYVTSFLKDCCNTYTQALYDMISELEHEEKLVLVNARVVTRDMI